MRDVAAAGAAAGVAAAADAVVSATFNCTKSRAEHALFFSFTIIAFNSLELTLVSDVAPLLLLLLLLFAEVGGAAV